MWYNACHAAKNAGGSFKGMDMSCQVGVACCYATSFACGGNYAVRFLGTCAMLHIQHVVHLSILVCKLAAAPTQHASTTGYMYCASMQFHEGLYQLSDATCRRMQLVGGHNTGNGDAPLEEAMVAALHKYINEHRRGRRPAAEEPVSSAARRLARGQAAMATQRKPAAVHKPGVGAADASKAQPKQSGKRPRQDGDDQAGDRTDAPGTQRKTRAKRKATNGATTAAADPAQEEGDGGSETEAEAPAGKRAKGKKKLKPRAKGSAAEAIGNVALGDGGSGVLERGASGTGASSHSMTDWTKMLWSIPSLRN